VHRKRRGAGQQPGGVVRYEEFEQLARNEWEQIPESYRAGVDGLVVERDARAHPTLPDIYTLGECITEAYPSDFGSPETTRSLVVVFYGSFHRLARLDPDFDWESELWETLTHELQHHLESLADDEGLIDLDYAVDEGFKRRDGSAFDPAYYRAGEHLGAGLFRVEDELFVECSPDAGADLVQFELDGQGYRVQLPPDMGDVAFLDVVQGLPPDAPPLTVVVVRRRGFGDLLRAAWRRGERRIIQTQVAAETL
jgi:hypothetical protein